MKFDVNYCILDAIIYLSYSIKLNEKTSFQEFDNTILKI